MPLPTINAVWIGRQMGPMHAACLRSFIATDHKVILHSYGPVDDAPRGVTYADANLMLPEQQLVRHKSGSLAISSDYIRFEIMRHGLGLYVDCDVYCFNPIEDAEYIFGWERHNSINCAILKIPHDSPLVASLLTVRRRGWVPPWPSRRRPFYAAAAAVGLPVSPQRMPWAWSGPMPMTWYAKQHGLDKHARPTDVFYPVAYDHAHLLLDPDLTWDELLTSRSRYIHLFHNLIGGMVLKGVPDTSPMGVLMSGAPLKGDRAGVR